MKPSTASGGLGALFISLLALISILPQLAMSDVQLDCTRLNISREVTWLPAGESSDVIIRWVVVVSRDTEDLRPTNIEIEGSLPIEAERRVRQEVNNMTCALQSSGRASRVRVTGRQEYRLEMPITFLGAVPKVEPQPAARAIDSPQTSMSQPEALIQDFNPSEQHIELKLVVDSEEIAGKDCRISVSGEHAGFPMNKKSGAFFVTPRTLNSNVLIASCEVLPYIALSHSITRDSETGVFPSVLQITISGEALAALQAESEAEIRRLEEQFAIELANERRQVERARIEAVAAQQRALEAQQAEQVERQEREAQLAEARAEAEKKMTVIQDALDLLRTAQAPLLRHYERQGRWPVALTGPHSFRELLENYSSEHAFNLRVTQSSTTPFESVTVTVTLYNAPIEGNLSLAYDGRIRQWICFSIDIPEEVLPAACGSDQPQFPRPTSVFDL